MEFLGGLFRFSNPALTGLVPTVITAYVLQIIFAIPAILFQEDRFFGLKLMRWS
jgi:hypothetical protein